MIDGYLFKYLLRIHLNINYYMRRFIFFFFFINLLWSQQVSIADINKLSNNQLDLIKEELQQQNQQTIQTEDKTLDNPMSNVKIGSLQDDSIDLQDDSIDLDDEYFGYNYFNQEINFFDNIPTPADFKLGPGDEVILSLWGETNQRNTYLIDKNGMIFFESIGFVNISNKTIKEAEILLIGELSKIYATLKDNINPTSLTLELGKIKSINVYFTGQVAKPGVSLIHPFSDVFSALVQVGGVDRSGSLRQVKLIRNNEVIDIIDFYSFFTSGLSSFQKVRIIDSDVIHIPTVKRRVQIAGEINKPKFYELLDTDLLSNLIEYAGGLTATSSNKAIIENIIPLDQRLSDDFARSSSSLVDLSLSSRVSLNNGDFVNLLPIADNDFSVTVRGRVTLPGEYPAFKYIYPSKGKKITESLTLKEVLDLSGGFDDPIFRKSINDNIIILRLDENKFYAEEIKINYVESENFPMKINDQIFVYENPNYYNDFSYEITGEVKKPGVYPLKQGLTLSEALTLAGGISEMGSFNSLSVTKEIKIIDEKGDEIIESELVGNIDLQFEITDGNIINVLPKTNVVKVDGNVYSPGFIAHNTNKNLTMADAIELAGGYKPYSLKKRAYVIRANGEIEQADIFRGRAKRVYPGDAIFVPIDPNPDDFDITSFIADLSSTLANIAAILIIADNN